MQLRPALGLLALAPGAVVAGDDCLDYESYVHYLGATESHVVVNDIATQGDIAVAVSGDGAYAMRVDAADDRGYFPMTLAYPGSFTQVAATVAGFAGDGYALVDGNQITVVEIDPLTLQGSVEYGLSFGANVVDVTDTPTLLIVTADGRYLRGGEELELPSTPVAVASDEPFGYVLLDDGDLIVIDNFGDHGAPSIVGTVATDASHDQLVVIIGYAFVSHHSSDTVDVYNCKTPTDPEYLTTWSTERGDLVTDGRYIYRGGAVHDGTAPTTPVELGRVRTLDVDAAGDGRFVSGSGGIVSWTVPVSDVDPMAFPVPATTSAPAGPMDIAGDGHRLGVLHAGGLQLYDVTLPGSPAPAGNLPLTDPKSVAIQGTHAYLVDGDRFVVADIATLAAPVEIAELTVMDAEEVQVRGAAAGVLAQGFTLTLVDVSDPMLPLAASQLAQIRGFEFGPEYLYVANGGGTCVVDIDPLDSPMFLGGCGSSPREPAGGFWFTADVTAAGNYLFCHQIYETYFEGQPPRTQVLDASNPSSLQLVTHRDPIGRKIRGRAFPNLYGEGTIHVLDTPSTPRSIGDVGQGPTWLGADRLYRLDLVNEIVEVYPVQCGAIVSAPGIVADAPTLVTHANPVRAADAITFDVRDPRTVRLEILDASGRLVRTFAISADGARVRWDLLDSAGRPVAPGVFFHRLIREGAPAVTGRVVVLR